MRHLVDAHGLAACYAQRPTTNQVAIRRRKVGRSRVPVRSACKHASPVVVNAVEGGGHRAHCLACGMVGPVRETIEAARRAISSGDGPADPWTGSDTRSLEKGG
jgi:hypothetical protein